MTKLMRHQIDQLRYFDIHAYDFHCWISNLRNCPLKMGLTGTGGQQILDFILKHVDLIS